MFHVQMAMPSEVSRDLSEQPLDTITCMGELHDAWQTAKLKC
jgi:hypothetical protein